MVLGWRFVSGLYEPIMGEFGWMHVRAAAVRFISPCRSIGTLRGMS